MADKWAVQVNEGYPMAAPTSTVLQATKRATRYWPLYHQVLAAVTAAYSRESEALATGFSKAAVRDPLDDINSLPGAHAAACCLLWPCHCSESQPSKQVRVC